MTKRENFSNSFIGELNTLGYSSINDDKKIIDSVENMEYLRDCLEKGCQLTPAIHKWLMISVERWLQGEPLSDAFNISDDARERRYRRDKKLNDYADLLGGSTWLKSCFIASEVKKLRQKSRQGNEIIKAIDTIFKIPESARQINRILQSIDKRHD